ncbi:SsrA-binding protein SmpB [Termitidicoccus mucosus]|uniref:SsrA-binding protein n=1 Tax=Termitidicoccus mucosus TaxID=1184151 RepID=A0A178IBG6_9BACT|nr:SsrA-binding protein [Opitutaceae bacterium TSB47]
MSAAKKKSEKRYTEIRNAKAGRDYFVDERFEAGIVLKGTEVKSIRAGRAQINDAFGRFEKGELWLHGAHIEEYAFGNIYNHDARSVRKLLLHRHEIRKIAQALQAGGRALIPLRMYFKDGLVKLEVALCSGKKLFDKRDDLKKRAELREVEKALKYRRR